MSRPVCCSVRASMADWPAQSAMLARTEQHTGRVVRLNTCKVPLGRAERFVTAARVAKHGVRLADVQQGEPGDDVAVVLGGDRRPMRERQTDAWVGCAV